MSNTLLQTSKVVQSQLVSNLPEFFVGSVVEVSYKIIEGEKERVQNFKGLVTNRHAGTGIDSTFTVLKNSTFGVKVERTFPLHSPNIVALKVINPQRARRANLRNMVTLKDAVKSVRGKKMKLKSTQSIAAETVVEKEVVQAEEVVE